MTEAEEPPRYAVSIDSSAADLVSGPRWNLPHPSAVGVSLGSWPKAELAGYLQACERAAAFLAAGGGDRLRQSFPAARAALSALPPQTDARIAPALGFSVGEVEPEVFRFPPPEACPSTRAEPPEVVLYLAHWAQSAAAFQRDICQLLATGNAVVVFAAPRLPMIAQALCTRLDQIGLPQGALQVLYPAAEDFVWTALGVAQPTRLVGAGARAQGELLRQRCSTATGPAFDRLSKPNTLAVGSTSVEWQILAPGYLQLALDADPKQAAALALRLAFGRSAALSGQLPTRLGRVLCHPRRLAAFSAELMDGLGHFSDLQQPLAAYDDKLYERLAEVRELGLDEGATLLYDGQAELSGQAAAPRLYALIFTNVEPGMRLATIEDALPLLCLKRESLAEDPLNGILRLMRSTGGP